MNMFVENFRHAINGISKEKGKFVFAGLFLTEDNENDKWDFVVGAEWINAKNEEDNFDYIISILQKELSSEDIAKFNGLVLSSASQSFIKNILNLYNNANIENEFYNLNLKHVNILHGYILEPSIKSKIKLQK